ncbi:putative DNA-binding protein (MmcQ/YjbR family) [Herbihabitans rhizosphaerae]|uniref:Putative DNA-binding protein (MmcQ/YjbR family) n=1 Tax=Herbihabitans rhizosphaerae TaxID=1872711 RepID=A0A4Q7KK76_9PSEU|nr:MmcQ/YjbR family DNA-binding protein [Herbihabitans rhizosphaerae]RZS36614.1 putative DNA-binding protein (MmcQ/YjbR family) [Herbihabitans rhizosphaerae]
MLAQDIHAEVLEFALRFPEAYGEPGWGGTIVKVRKKMFVYLNADDGDDPVAYNVKLADPDAHAHALSLPRAARMGALGQYGWVYVPFGAHTPVDLLCEWVEDSYRAIAPKKLVAELG